MRIRPYRTLDNVIEGAVISFIDITELKQSKDASRAGQLFGELIIDTLPEPLLVLSQDLCLSSANKAFYIRFKMEPKESIGQNLFALDNGQWDIPELHQLLDENRTESDSLNNIRIIREFKRIGRCMLELNARRLRRPTDQFRNHPFDH